MPRGPDTNPLRGRAASRIVRVHSERIQIMRDSYDEIAYPGSAFADMHPDRLATIARLHGLDPAPPDRCRVLELGCGDAGNLLSLAQALPGSSFLGIDRAPGTIERGRALAERAGLDNVRLEVADLLEVPARLGEFDMILAQGLYSWVPEPVRRRVLEICAASLAPHGIAFISYLALPGNHARNMFREAMLFHVRGIAEPLERVRQARALMRLLSEAPGGRPEYRAIAKSVAEELERADDGVVYHDFLAENNVAFLFRDFMRDAAGAGLQFLAEAELHASVLPAGGAPPFVADALRRLEADVLQREQYWDFFRYRAFRQTLLCRRELEVRRPASSAAVPSMHVAAHVATRDGTVDLRDGVPVQFAFSGREWQLSDGVWKTALAVLGSRWPEALPFASLAARVAELGPRAPDAGALADFLLNGAQRGAIELWTCPPPCGPVSGDRITASPLARAQVAGGRRVVFSLRNETIDLFDDMAAATLELLDGTRDRERLLDGLIALLGERGAHLELDGQPITGEAEVRRVLDGRLNDALEQLAENSLILADAAAGAPPG